MILIGLWFAGLVTSTTELVMATLSDRQGWGRVFDIAFVVLYSYLFAGSVKDEFFNGRKKS